MRCGDFIIIILNRPSRSVLAASLAALIALSLGSVPALSVMYNRDTGDEKSQELARQTQFDSKARMGGCSAVLIAPDAALFARHCVRGKETGRVAINWNGQARGGTFWSHPKVGLLVIKLDKPFDDAKVTPPYTGCAEEGKLVWKVGRGGSEVLEPGAKPFRNDGKFRAMSNRIEVDRVPDIAAVTDTEIRYDFDGPPSKPYKDTGTPFEGGTAPGDSGGPMYMEEHGQWFVVGVTSGPRTNYYADGRVSRAIPFIEEKTGHSFSATADGNAKPSPEL